MCVRISENRGRDEQASTAQHRSTKTSDNEKRLSFDLCGQEHESINKLFFIENNVAAGGHNKQKNNQHTPATKTSTKLIHNTRTTTPYGYFNSGRCGSCRIRCLQRRRSWGPQSQRNPQENTTRWKTKAGTRRNEDRIQGQERGS